MSTLLTGALLTGLLTAGLVGCDEGDASRRDLDDGLGVPPDAGDHSDPESPFTGDATAPELDAAPPGGGSADARAPAADASDPSSWDLGSWDLGSWDAVAVGDDAEPFDGAPFDDDARRPACPWAASPVGEPYEGLPVRWADHCLSTAFQPPPRDARRVVLIGDDIFVDLGTAPVENAIRSYQGGLRYRLAQLLGRHFALDVPDAATALGQRWYRATRDTYDAGSFWGCAEAGVGLHDLIVSDPARRADGWIQLCIEDSLRDEEAPIILIVGFGLYRRTVLERDQRDVGADAEALLRRFTDTVRDLRAWTRRDDPDSVRVYVTDFIDYTNDRDALPEVCGLDPGPLADERALIADLNAGLMRAATEAADDPAERFDVILANAAFADRAAPCADADDPRPVCANHAGCGSLDPLAEQVLDTCCLSAPPDCLRPDLDGYQVLARTITRVLIGDRPLQAP